VSDGGAERSWWSRDGVRTAGGSVSDVRQIWAYPQAAGTIVVGCDGSWESQNAVAVAARQASLRGAELILLAVARHRPYLPDRLAWVSRAEAASARYARVSADHAMAYVVATEPKVAVKAVVVSQLDSPELAEVARQAGLLVLGRRGGGGQVAFSMGSTSAELARRLQCPMLVVHDEGQNAPSERPARGGVVVAGMDLVNGANNVLAVAVLEAVTRDQPLVVVHTLQRGREVDRAMIAQGWRSCRAALRDAHLPAGVPERLVVTWDDTVPALLHLVGPGDLLVVGTHGHGRLAGLVPGSVSRQVLDNMTCNVMVVPPTLKTAEPAPDRPRRVSGPAPVPSRWAGASVAPDRPERPGPPELVGLPGRV